MTSRLRLRRSAQLVVRETSRFRVAVVANDAAVLCTKKQPRFAARIVGNEHGSMRTVKPVDLRAFAREWEGGCMIRVPGVCQWTPTCLCHDRTAGTAGRSQKPPDLIGAIGCDACHGVVDRRTHLNVFNYDEVKLFRHEGLIRTLDVYSKTMILVEKDQ